MKIYTKHVSQWLPDGSLQTLSDECESFDYEGPVDKCGAINAPPPAPNYTRNTGAAPGVTANRVAQLPQMAQAQGGIAQARGFGPPTGGALGGIFGAPGSPQMPAMQSPMMNQQAAQQMLGAPGAQQVQPPQMQDQARFAALGSPSSANLTQFGMNQAQANAPQMPPRVPNPMPSGVNSAGKQTTELHAQALAAALRNRR
jgi:hypothetical protein